MAVRSDRSRPSPPSTAVADARPRWQSAPGAAFVFVGYCPQGCATAVTADAAEARAWGIRYERMPGPVAAFKLRLCTHDLRAGQPRPLEQLELGAA